MASMDITAGMNNSSMISSKCLDEQNHTPTNISHVPKAHSTPSHFMTPTFASRRSEIGKSNNRIAAHVSIKSIKADGGHSLLNSVAKRVGLRVGDGGTQKKKEGPAKHSKVISFPDKLSAHSGLMVLDSPATPSENDRDAPNTSPLDKPLPNLPPNQLDMSSPSGSLISLLEPIEKPLPAFASESSFSEEWTVLEPNLPLSPGTLQKMMRQTGNELKRHSVSGERYPKLGNTTRQPQDAGQRPVMSRYSPMYQIPRKEISSSNLRESSNTNSTLHVVNGLSDPFGDDAEVIDPVIGSKTKASIDNHTAATAATEKAAKEAIAIPISHQRKTSSLRARLSVGQLVKDEQTKVLGFTDFTASRALSDPLTGLSRSNSYRTLKEAQARRSNDSLRLSVRTKASIPSSQKKKLAQSLHSNKSTESLVKGHAPAQFVGGSRRPARPHRLGSRGSNRNASQSPVSAPSSHPSSGQSQAPPSLAKKCATLNDGVYPIIERQVKPRKSSIPVPTHIALNTISQADTDSPLAPKSTQASFTLKKVANNESAIFKNRSSSEPLFELEADSMSAFRNRGSALIFKDAKESRSLAAIEESPQQSFTTKHLSMKSPELGPSLRISPSAERFILGNPDADNANKENQPIYEKMTKSFLQKATNGVFKRPTSFVSPASTSKKHPERPLSSHGMLQLSSRHRLVDSKAREKKVKSADMSSRVLANFDSTPDPTHTNKDARKVSKASFSNDPFFDAQEGPCNPVGDGPLNPPKPEGSEEVIDEAAWISPVKEKSDEALAEVEKTKLHSSALAKNDEAQHRKTSPNNPIKDFEVNTKNFVQLAANARNHILKQQEPRTPNHSSSETRSTSSSHPPRSSSRVAHPDYTTASVYPTLETAEKALPTPQKDKNRRQNFQTDLRALHGLASSQVDITNFGSKRVSSVRDSIAGDSHKSGGSHSLSRNPFHNFRNLFDKRTSTPNSSESKPEKSDISKTSTTVNKPRTKNQKIAITSSGFPFQPIHSIPLIHRPTFASSSQANTACNAPSAAKSTAPTSTPTLTSPSPTSISATTTLAMNLLTAARNEQSSPRKKRLLQMSKIMVDAITQARDAEKAAEEAKMAARKAEVAREVCEGSVGELGRLVGEWMGGSMGEERYEEGGDMFV